jgi:hypothetical protein
MSLMTRAAFTLLIPLIFAGCDSSNDAIQNPDYTQDVVIDISAVTISGDFTLNNGSFPVSFYNNGEISLRDTQNLAYTVLGDTWEGGYSDLLVVNGIYDSTYRRKDGVVLPQNITATAVANEQIDMDAAVDVNVPRAIVVPTFTLDGNAFPSSVYNSAELFLRPVGGNELISLGTTNLQPAEDVTVIPGTYDVIYSIREGDQLPQNQYAIIMRRVEIATTPHALNIDVETVLFNGSWRLAVDGVLGEFPDSVYHRGEFSLATDLGDHVPLGPSHMSAGTVPAVAGTYNVMYRHLDGDQVPQNNGTVIEAGLVLPPGQVFYESVVDAWTVMPAFALNGGPFPGSVYEKGEVFLKDQDTDTLTSLGNTHNAPPNLMMVEGEYDVVYNHVDGSTVPQNKGSVLSDSIIVDEADVAADIDVDAITVEGAFSLDGGDFIESVYEVANFRMYKNGTGAPILLGQSHQDSEPVVILAGRYDIAYEHVDGEHIPQNPRHLVIADQNYASDSTISINVPSRPVRPAFTLNGEEFPTSPYETADLFLLGNHRDDYVFLGPTTGTDETTLVIQSNYDAIYRFVQGSSVPQNTEAVVGQVLVD